MKREPCCVLNSPTRACGVEHVRLRLSLNCDMLIDYRGRAVDAEHLHGQVRYWKSGEPTGGRSGDGREGGVFQSWSTISKC